MHWFLLIFFFLIASGQFLFGDASEVAQAQVDCSALTADEEQFAANLNDANRTMFCQQFNGDQRAAAMSMVGQRDINGNSMDANMAVQKVAADNNIVPPNRYGQQPRSGGRQPGSSGGCPPRKRN